MPTVSCAALGMALIFWHAMIAHAQQPFLTDDAETAAVRHYHFPERTLRPTTGKKVPGPLP